MGKCKCKGCSCFCEGDQGGTSEPPKKNIRCYWFKDGKCFLYDVSPEWVFDIMSKSPKAAQDLLRCSSSSHCDVPEEYVEQARRGIKSIEAMEDSDRWQRASNRYVDRHRQIAGNVFRYPPKPKADDGEE